MTPAALLLVGEKYGTLGGGENYDEVTIESIDEAAGVYRTKGTRQVAPVIRFGCEGNWRHIPA